MVELNKIYNEDCFQTIKRMKEENVKINAVLTSPPYNTGRLTQTQRSIDNHENRYDIHLDNKTDEEYLNWSVDLFNAYDSVLIKDGVVLYNVSYSAENNPNIMWLLISEIINKTNFMVADCIIWKKGSALPNNVSPNKLTRITEFVFVFCRKSEYKTFTTNKKIKSRSKTGQAYYENVFNFIEARNNDGSNNLNKATFSTEFCEKLIDIYLKKGNLVYDSFMGTGTTANACQRKKLNFIGSELSENQCKYAMNRLNQKTLFNSSPTSQTSPNGDFSNEKEHNISYQTTQQVAPSKSATPTSDNNNIMFNRLTPTQNISPTEEKT